MALNRRLSEFYLCCGERRVTRLHPDGSVAWTASPCRCIPGPPGAPMNHPPGSTLLEAEPSRELKETMRTGHSVGTLRATGATWRLRWYSRGDDRGDREQRAVASLLDWLDLPFVVVEDPSVGHTLIGFDAVYEHVKQTTGKITVS